MGETMPRKGNRPKGFTSLMVLEKILSVGQSLTSVRDLDSLLLKISESAASILEADATVLYEYREDTDDIRIPPVTFGEFQRPEALKSRSYQVPHRESAVFKMLKRNRPFYAPDAVRDWGDFLKIEPGPEAENFIYREKIVSSAAVPLTSGAKIVGVLFLNYRSPHSFSREEKKAINLFAIQAAIAIQNAHLLDDAVRRIQDLQVLNEVAQKMSGKLNTRDLLSFIASQIVAKLKCTHCSIFFPEIEGGITWLVPQVIRGERSEQIASRRFASGEGLAGWVFESGNPIVLPDAREHPRFMPARERSTLPRSMLVVPIKVGDQTVGVISADQDKYNWFNTNDCGLVEALARQAGIAIQRNRGLELLQDIGKRINSAQQVEEILQSIVSGAIELTHTSSGVIYLLSKDKDSISRSFKYPPGSHHPPPRMHLEGSLTRQVIATGEVLTFFDINKDNRVNPVLRGKIHSMIAVPLKLEKEVIGVLYLNDEHPHDFSETEKSFLATITNQAAIGLHKAQLLDDLKRQVDRHRVLNQLGANFTGMQKEPTILRAVARSAARTLDCTHCSVFVVEKDKLVVWAAHGDFEHVLRPGRAFPLGQGLAGWVAVNGKPARVGDTDSDARFDPTWSDPHPRSLVAVPITIDQKVYGVISVEHQKLKAFDDEDQRLLETLAVHVGQAVRSARRIQDLEILNKAGRLISGQLEIERLIDTLLNTVNKTLDCQYSTLFTVDPSGNLVGSARKGRTKRDVRSLHFLYGEGLVGWVAQNGKSLNIRDVDKDTRALPISKTILPGEPHSILLAPMLSQGRVIGVISADKDIIGGFTKNDERLLETIASQAAVAYENAQLYQSVKQQSEELSLLHDINTKLLTLDLDKLLDLIVRGAERLTETEIGIIYLLSEDGTRIVRSYSTSKEFQPSRFELSEKGSTYQIYRTGQPVFVPDTSKEDRVSDQVAELNIKSYIGQPLKVGEKVIGVLYLNDRSPRQFNEAEKRLSATLALQAAIAIENARLYQQSIKDTDAIRKLVEIVGAIGVGKSPLPVILDETVKLFPLADFGSIATINRDARQYLYHVILDGKEMLEEGTPIHLRSQKWKESIAGNVVRQSALYRTSNVENNPRFKPQRKGTASVLAVPLRAGTGRVIGVLNLESTLKDAFSQHDANLCQDIANVITIAFEKDRIYEDLQRRVRYMDALNRVVSRLSELPDRQEIFDTVVKEANSTLDAVRCTLFTLETEDDLLVPQSVEGVPLEIVDDYRFHLGEGLAGWVAQEGLSLYLPDASQDARFIPDALSDPGVSRPMVLAPIWMEGKVIGVMSADRDGGSPFDDADLRFLEILAVQAGIFVRQENLRRQRLDAITRKFNPYIFGQPIYDPQMFFGRARLIQYIINGIHNNNFIIYGERRIGKTSLLIRISDYLRKLSEQDQKYFFLPVFSTLQGIAEDQFFSFLVGQIARAAVVPQDRLLIDSPAGDYDHIHFEQDLEAVVAVLQEREPGKEIRIVLLLDEMDQFVGYKSITHDRFRSLFTTRPGKYLKMIMAGVAIQRISGAQTSPWYNLFEEIELSPLGENTARQLVVEPVLGYYIYDPDALKALIDFSDLKPIEIQHLAHLSVEVMLNRIYSEISEKGKDLAQIEAHINFGDVQIAMDLVLIGKNSEFSDFWSRLDATQRQALHRAKDQHGRVDANEMRADGSPLFSREELYNITCKEDSKPRLTKMFIKWLEGNQP